MNGADALVRTRRLALVLAALCVALALGCGLLFNRLAAARREAHGDLRADPEARRAAVAELVKEAGVWDGAAADVGHLLAPGLVEREHAGFRISSDALGLREREIALPKPTGTVRVVLLGDSFVMGHGVAADERFGVFLERFLRERAGPAAPQVEVLHAGVDTWNLHAECSFLRRALTPLAPDLVVHVVISNDVDDNPGVRGFGALSASDPIHPERAGTLFQVNGPNWLFDFDRINFLAHGLDLESRERYAQAAADVAALARAIAAGGGRYVVVDHFGPLLAVARARLLAGLPAGSVVHLPNSFFAAPDLHVSKGDWHWNRRGHEQVAQLLYAAIRAGSLLPKLALPPWPEAEERFASVAAEGAAEAARDPEAVVADEAKGIGAALDFTKLDASGAAQVHGGISKGGLVGPYASVILRDEGRRELVLQGSCFKRGELAGARARVSVEEAAVGEVALDAKGALEERFAIPAEIAARRFVTVRIVSTDFAAAGPDLKSALCLQLRRIALE